MRDPWVILGLSRDSSDSAIKERYRQLAREMHPDRNRHDPEAASRFQEVALAYESIRSAEKRASWQAENESPLDFQPPSESVDVQISFLEAYSGAQKAVSVSLDEVCRRCGGSGAAPGASPRRCANCNGSGQVVLGELHSVCRDCGGHGYTLPHPCPGCTRGRVSENREVLLRVPPGVPHGQTLLLSEGPHNFAFRVLVEDSPVFERKPESPADLLIHLPVAYSEALLGASVRIPTPERVVEFQIPPHTSSGKVFRISGEGMPIYEGSGRGDLYVEVQIAIPEDVSKRHEDAVQEMSRGEDYSDLRLGLFRS